MTIKKFQGKTKEEAIARAKEEMGSAVVIMNVKEVRQKGIFGFFKGSLHEVTAALEDEETPERSFTIPQTPANEMPSRGFQAVADEKISLKDLPEDTVALKEAFAAVNKVMEMKAPETRTQGRNQQEGILQERKESDGSYRNNALSEMSRQEKRGPEPMTPLRESQAAKMTREPFQPLQEMEFIQEIPTENEENSRFFKILYNVLLENEVDEIYINQFMDDIDRASRSTNGLDYLISSVYQKMILKLGQPEVISLSQKKPKVVFFIGPTGVGKTTTIAKIASRFKVEQDKKVALLTADTYRIAAAEQLRTYANILDTPLSIIYTPEEIGNEIAKYSDHDLILIDTAGFSHKNDGQKEDMKRLLENLPDEYESQVFLVLSATTKYKDLIEITDIYSEFCDYSLIFTKLDETGACGNILNIKLHTNAPISYVTDGQNVPDDIEVVDTQKLVKQLLGGQINGSGGTVKERH